MQRLLVRYAGLRGYSKVPSQLLYTPTHEWVSVEGNTVTLGVTEYAQDALGEVVYVDIPSEGDAVEEGEAVSALESVKSASDIYTPVKGTVQAANALLADDPALINRSPYEEGWIVKIDKGDREIPSTLLSAEQYHKIIE